MNLAWTSSPLWLLINALVAYRLTRLWVDDTLPPLPMLRLHLSRRADLAWHKRLHPYSATTERWAELDDLKRAYSSEDHPVKALWECYGCAGFWISVGVFLAASLIPLTIWAFLAVPLAMSTAVVIIASRV